MRDAPTPCLVVTLALASCMGRTTPVAVAYAEPAPVRHDAAHHPDGGDRLRVVVPLSPGDTVLVGERWF
jgi:polysaccharide export outer membrane protein